jgi:hypothetical protein
MKKSRSGKAELLQVLYPVASILQLLPTKGVLP